MSKDIMGDIFIKWAESQGFKFVDATVYDPKTHGEKVIRTLEINNSNPQKRGRNKQNKK